MLKQKLSILLVFIFIFQSQSIFAESISIQKVSPPPPAQPNKKEQPPPVAAKPAITAPKIATSPPAQPNKKEQPPPVAAKPAITAPKIATSLPAQPNKKEQPPSAAPKEDKQRKFFKIATHTNDVSVANIICSLMNANTKYPLACNSIEIDNPDRLLEGLNNGDFDIVLVQSFALQNKNNAKKLQNLRAILATDMKVPILMVNRNVSRINKIEDLNDKIIDVGKYHSNNEYIAKLIFNSLNIGEVNFQYSDDENRAIRLCKGQVDASLVYGIVENNLVKKMTDTCEIEILPLPSELINQVVNNNKVFSQQSISGNYYLSNPINKNVFGSPMIFLSNKDFDRTIVNDFVTIIFEKLNILQKVSKSFVMSKKDMANNFGLIETHEGAKIYYKQNKLIE